MEVSRFYWAGKSTDLVDGIIRVYREAFAGPPWFEEWSEEAVHADFSREMSRPGAICVVASEDQKVVGFAWGYSVKAGSELDDHVEAPDLHSALEQGSYFYLDECAVSPSYQGRGAGKLLVNAILGEQGHGRVILRTMAESRMHHLILRHGGEVMQEISRGRVIMRLIT